MNQLVIPQTVAVAVEAEIDGLEMGVLADGTPYLTQRALAKACGIGASTLIEQVQAWAEGKRTSKLAQSLIAVGYNGDSLSVKLAMNKHAVIDSLCIVILEHYAFEAQNSTAQANYRVLARAGLRAYIYAKVGYSPSMALPRGWRDFHDRLLLSKITAGYFGVFKEMSEFLLRAIQGGLVIDEKTVPDISVGQMWGKHWTDNNLDTAIGPRQKCEHNYPDYYPQAASNPQDIWVYPMAALGMFRVWLDEVYIPEKFPNYLQGQIRKNALTAVKAEQLIAAVTPSALPAP